jgi:AcrR family transcriptional regulator
VTQRTYTKRDAQAAATREQLLQAARVVFAERGYSGATVSLITKRASTAHGTFYLYFRNKDEAFSEVVEGVMLEIHDQVLNLSVDTESDLRALLHEALRRFFETFAANREIWRTLLEGALSTPEIAQRWSGISRRFHERVRVVLDELQAAGLVRPVDSASMAVAIASMGQWMAMSRLFFTPNADDERFLDSMVDVWFHALAPTEAVG